MTGAPSKGLIVAASRSLVLSILGQSEDYVTSAHYASIREYALLWSAGVSINIRTTGGGDNWYRLGGTWSGQEGVCCLD